MKKSNSAVFLPKISSSYNGGSIGFKNDTFITDDIGFARIQVDKINQSITAQRLKELKPWEKSTNNNIYSSYGKSNYQIKKDLSKKFKTIIEKSDNVGSRGGCDVKLIDWSNQNY